MVDGVGTFRGMFLSSRASTQRSLCEFLRALCVHINRNVNMKQCSTPVWFGARVSKGIPSVARRSSSPNL